jgi:hypothetical protein
MKIGLIIYHKNIFNYVNAQIIANCLNSIKNQTFDSFDILELDYSNVNQIPIRLVDNNFKQKSYFMKRECRNHIEAMNYLLSKAFNEMNYDVIFNINIDDIYDIHRIEFQLRKILIDKYDLVCSNYEIFQIKNGIESSRKITILPSFDNKSDEQTYIKMKIPKNKCIAQLSSMCFTKDSWKIIQKIDLLPTLESLLIFKKLIKANKKIHICKDFLLKYRIHENQYSNKYRKNIL